MPTKTKPETKVEELEVVFLNVKGRGKDPKECGMKGLGLLQPLSTIHLGVGIQDPSHAHGKVSPVKTVKLEIIGVNGESRFRLIDARNGSVSAGGKLLSRERADRDTYPNHELLICISETYPEIEVTCRPWDSVVEESRHRPEPKAVHIPAVVLGKGVPTPAVVPRPEVAPEPEPPVVVSAPQPLPPPVIKPAVVEKKPVVHDAAPNPRPNYIALAAPKEPPRVKMVIEEINVGEIERYEDQPREEFGEAREMAASLRQEGQLQVITVMPITNVPGKRWGLVNGEQRLNGAIEARMTTIWASIIPYQEEKDRFWKSVLHNFGHKVHTPFELAKAVVRLLRDGKTPKEISIGLNRTLTWVYQWGGLKDLDPTLFELMRESVPKCDRMRGGMAKLLVKQPDHARQRQIWELACQESSSAKRLAVIRREIEGQTGKRLSASAEGPRHFVRIITGDLSRIASHIPTGQPSDEVVFLLGQRPDREKLREDLQRAEEYLRRLREGISKLSTK